jgi:hypothetical protein
MELLFMTLFIMGLTYTLYSIVGPSSFKKRVDLAIKQCKERKLTPYKDLKKQWKAEEKWDKAHPIQAYVKNILWHIRHIIREIPELPRYGYRKIKRGLQRAYFGICDEDAWALDHYFSKVILIGLRRLQKLDRLNFRTKNTGNDDKDYDKKETNRILGEMIYSFDINEKIANGDIEGYYPQVIKKLSKKRRKDYLTLQEDLRRKVGMKYFIEYYFSLWD